MTSHSTLAAFATRLGYGFLLAGLLSLPTIVGARSEPAPSKAPACWEEFDESALGAPLILQLTSTDCLQTLPEQLPPDELNLPPHRDAQPA